MIKYAQLDGGIMSDIERMTVTMPAEMAAAVKSAVDAGDYASTSEVVRAALRDWKMKRALQIEELAALKPDIDAGLAMSPPAGSKTLTRPASSRAGGGY
jgi:putative addiction module CopG family antidote